MVREQYPHEAKAAIDQLLPPWLAAFLELLSVDVATEVQRDWETIRIRKDIFTVCPTVRGAVEALTKDRAY